MELFQKAEILLVRESAGTMALKEGGNLRCRHRKPVEVEEKVLTGAGGAGRRVR